MDHRMPLIQIANLGYWMIMSSLWLSLRCCDSLRAPVEKQDRMSTIFLLLEKFNSHETPLALRFHIIRVCLVMIQFWYFCMLHQHNWDS